MFHLVYAVLYLFSLLPLGLLYVFSDFFFLLVYHVFKYRRKVVQANLQLAFPEKDINERNTIEKRFYRNLVDTLFETIKLFSASEKFILKHVSGDYSLVDELYNNSQKAQLLLGHHFNWELSNLYGGLRTRQKFIGVYMPLKSSLADRLFKKMRSRTGTVLIPATNMLRSMLPFRNETYILALMADQTPATPSNAYWVNFFGRPTAFLKGAEKGAIAGNVPVLFAHFVKERRGYYRFIVQMGEAHPSALQAGELTMRYAAFMEKTIRQDPSMWLWSHRRWKHEWKPEYGQVMSIPTGT
jgi:Kdo2-lipid IVA lauroyltransferase/acyltransferase